ncbi:MAG: serine/threonine-protein kinase [Polyangiales bacterium]
MPPPLPVSIPMPNAAPPMPPLTSLPPGARLGRYEVVSELGTGGMATVYLGRALAAAGFQRLVAIKVLHPHLLKDEQFVQMFLDEGRLAARIHHPNVVGTLDLEHTEHGIFIVSEYIEGDQLLGIYKSARASEDRIPLEVSLRVALDVLAGLHCAHDLTDDLGTPLLIVHRDVSPHNILVGSDGISRLTDFGIARAEERISNTRDGIVKGKLSYMAPEQPDGLPFDRRADLFSMATVLWECLTGRRLFGQDRRRGAAEPLAQAHPAAAQTSTRSSPKALDEVLARAPSRATPRPATPPPPPSPTPSRPPRPTTRSPRTAPSPST